jgi:16S rRNA (guanine(1405)-N(7))-methyltransferase
MKNNDSANAAQKVAEAVQKGSRYQNVDQSLVLRIAVLELSKGRSFKAAVKAVRSKLHQVGSAYHTGKLDYAKWKTELQTLPHDLTATALQDFCCQAMEQHASTSERLPYLEDFFHETLAPLGKIESVLDLACGLNPLAIPWMPLSQNAAYYACDIYADMVAFLGLFLSHAGLSGEAAVCNLVEGAPPTRTQLALLLKSIPCLEHLDRDIGPRLLETIPADNILVSFPARSLGGRSKGMLENYESRFENIIAGKNWQVQRFEFPTELAFLIAR